MALSEIHHRRASNDRDDEVVCESEPLIPDSETPESDEDTGSNGSIEIMTPSHLLGAVANLCSATLGAGVLALPFALEQAGLVCGTILLLCSAWATSASIDLLVMACERFQVTTYEQAVEKILGRRFRKVVEISILIFCLGTAVAYVIAVGDILERVESSMSTSSKSWGMVVVWILAMLPLSCLRRIQSLQCASTVGIASIGTLLLAATVHLIAPQDNDNSMARALITQLSASAKRHTLAPYFGPAEGWISVLRACPIVFFAFSCQVNVCQIYDELPGPQRGELKTNNMRLVTWMAVGLCATLYSSISLVTLLDFGAGVEPNVLSCYTLGSKETLLHVAFLAMAVAVVMAFPLNVFPARVSIIQIWNSKSRMDDGSTGEYRGLPSGEEMEQRESTEDPQNEDVPINPTPEEEIMRDGAEDLSETGLLQHVTVTLLVAGLALGLALVIPNISVVFGLLGGTTSSLLGFVVPGLMGLHVNRSDTSAWILVVAGTLVGVLTTGVTLYSTFQEIK